MNLRPIYLDYNGTTPMDPRVWEVARPFLEEHFGNPSTRSPYGQRARQGLDQGRAQVAEFLGCSMQEVYFTSGATESNNWVLQAVVASHCGGAARPHVITSCIEHPSVGKTLDFLEQSGRAEVTRVGVDGLGRVSVDQVLGALRSNTVLVSIMHSNNEVGTLQPIEELARALAGKVPLHSDAAQSLGKVPLSLDGLSFLSLAGHKAYAPKGIGVLYVRQGARFGPLLFGAGHESGLRSGTENVAFAVAMGAACQLLQPQEGERLRRLRDRLWQGLHQGLGDRVERNGHPDLNLPNTLSVNFLHTTGAAVMAACPELAASTGPACHDGVVRLSHVLAAMGVEPEKGKGAVRLTLGRWTSEQEVDQAVQLLVGAYCSKR